MTLRLLRINIVLSLFIAFLFFPNIITAQGENEPAFVPKIELIGYRGALLIHRDAMEALGNNPYYGTELRMSFQTTGSKYWQKLFNYPIYGLGFYSGYFNNSSIGNPLALYAFMELPFLRREKFYMSTSWSAGVCFNINEYDSITNPDNVAIGSDMNVYVDFSTLARFKVSERLEIGGGIKLQHFSNGAVKLPNLGLNMYSAQLLVAYYPGRTITKFKDAFEPEPYKKYEITVMYAGGVRCKSETESCIKYYNSTVSMAVSRRLSFKRNLGIGTDIFYSSYLVNEFDKDPSEVPNSDLMSYGIFVSSDMIADKFRLVTQVGTYLWRATEYSIPIYERIALRYYFIPHMFANVSIKAHGAKAQYIEWGLGMAF